MRVIQGDGDFAEGAGDALFRFLALEERLLEAQLAARVLTRTHDHGVAFLLVVAFVADRTFEVVKGLSDETAWILVHNKCKNDYMEFSKRLWYFCRNNKRVLPEFNR